MIHCFRFSFFFVFEIRALLAIQFVKVQTYESCTKRTYLFPLWKPPLSVCGDHLCVSLVRTIHFLMLNTRPFGNIICKCSNLWELHKTYIPFCFKDTTTISVWGSLVCFVGSHYTLSFLKLNTRPFGNIICKRQTCESCTKRTYIFPLRKPPPSVCGDHLCVSLVRTIHSHFLMLNNAFLAI